ncbi:PAS domain S-box protein [Candidatus Peregrinibacteria bacterium]|nr:PAS domain S-box protein [Candidatus Peregrinibacteria bacterium]
MAEIRKSATQRRSVAPKKVLHLEKPIVLKKRPSDLSEIKFRRLVENMNEAVWMGNKNERTIYANPKFCQIMGYTLEEMLGRESYDFWTEESVKRVKEVNATDRQSGISSSYEGELLTKAGKRIPVLVSGTPLPDGGTIGIITDLTEVKKKEEDIKKLSNVVEQTADIVYITDKDGMIEYTNPASEKATGYTREEIIGRKPNFLKSGNHSPSFYEELWKTIRAGKAFRGEFINKKKNGEIYYEEKTITPLKDSRGEITHFVSTGKDITQRKLTEKALGESESKYRTIFENTGSATIIIQEDTIISLVNTEFEKISGYSKREIEGKKSWKEFFHKDDVEMMMDYHHLRRIDPQKAPRNYEARLVDRKGNMRDIFITVDLIPGTKSSVASFLDITERKKLSEFLANRLREFQVLYQVNAHTRMVTPLKEVLRKAAKVLVSACDEVKPARARIIFDGRTYTNLKKNETFLSKIQESLIIFGTKRGTIELGYVEKIADIFSFRLKQEKKVLHIVAQTLSKHVQSREIMERYQKVVKKSVTGIYIVENGILRYVNPRFYKIFKYKENEVLGQPIDLFIPDGKCHTALFETPNKGTLRCETKGRQKDGTLIDLEAVTQHIDYHGNRAILGRVHDITQLKQAEARLKSFNKELQEKIAEKTKDLQRANRRLKSLNELKDEFIAVTSHELRSPLTAIRGYLSFLVDDGLANEIQGEAKEYLMRVYDNVNTLNNLVNNILDVSRIETDRFELHRKPTDIAELTQKIIQDFSFQAKEGQLNIHFRNKLSSPVVLNIDSVRVQQVLRNILDNAIKYTMKGKDITVEVEMSGIGIQIAIIDQGVGIPKSQIFEIFDKFKQAKNCLTRYKGGAGLGLFITKKIVELHGGMIWAESEVKKGTTFRIQLPLD